MGGIVGAVLPLLDRLGGERGWGRGGCDSRWRRPRDASSSVSWDEEAVRALPPLRGSC